MSRSAVTEGVHGSAIPRQCLDKEKAMPKYLVEVSYTSDGAKGVLKDGGSKRRAAAKALIESVGAKMETFYYAFGDTDVIVIIDAPDAASAAAMSLAIGASGAVTARTTPLLTAEDIDAATKKSASYTAPGH
jgi:uncharacterized protein with GYD domain